MRGILFDQPHVVESARPMREAAGVADRCEVIGGSFFDAVPSGADAYTICNTMADWNDERGAAILKVCRRAIGDKGKLLVIDRVLP